MHFTKQDGKLLNAALERMVGPRPSTETANAPAARTLTPQTANGTYPRGQMKAVVAAVYDNIIPVLSDINHFIVYKDQDEYCNEFVTDMVRTIFKKEVPQRGIKIPINDIHNTVTELAFSLRDHLDYVWNVEKDPAAADKAAKRFGISDDGLTEDEFFAEYDLKTLQRTASGF